MNILLLGAGAREHALATALADSPLLTQLFVAPGNPGTARIARNVELDIADHAAVIAFCRKEQIALVVVGPEAPLVAGIVDDLMAAGIKAFGPSKAAAQLEGSKAFTKALCIENAIPTAAYARFSALAPALEHVRRHGAPIVVKYDGLMAGKGVTVATTIAEAEAALMALYAGEPEAVTIIEECLSGEEASLFCLVDGTQVLPIGSAQDHKRAYDGDQGPNTGGMGAYSPAPIMTAAMERRALDSIVRPTAAAMAARGTPYRGVLYAGLMIRDDGPKLIEYNCRFGDPEAQVLVLRLKDDLLTLMLATCAGALAHVSARLRDEAALCVVMATRGYPGAHGRGSAIDGLEAAAAAPGVSIFHAATRAEGSVIFANGGRVLSVCATGATLAHAREAAYAALAQIDWPEGFYRTDIGHRGLVAHADAGPSQTAEGE